MTTRIDRLEKAVLHILKSDSMDPRWRAIARTDIQKAFMSVRRAAEGPEVCKECGEK